MRYLDHNGKFNLVLSMQQGRGPEFVVQAADEIRVGMGRQRRRQSVALEFGEECRVGRQRGRPRAGNITGLKNGCGRSVGP